MKKKFIAVRFRFPLTFAAALMLCFCTYSNADEVIQFKKYPSMEFNPTQGQKFVIPFSITTKTDVHISIYTSDGDLVRSMKTPDPLTAGNNSLEWDGKDNAGLIVPDEAYIPVLTADTADNKGVIADPREIGGGEEIEGINITINSDKNIEYSLSDTARVLIRVGIKNGPMYRSLANWIPKTAGKNIQVWDGYDSDHLTDLRTHERLSALVTAFRLPPYVIITFGNNKLSYREYRKNKKWQDRSLKSEDMLLEKKNQRISRHYYYSRTLDIDPVVVLDFPDNLPLSENGIPVINERVKIKVDIPKDYLWGIQETLYEIAFYVDNEFISEEEQGYVPLIWMWKPVGLAKGKHILTVNVSGFRGQVGVKSLFFQVNNDRL